MDRWGIIVDRLQLASQASWTGGMPRRGAGESTPWEDVRNPTAGPNADSHRPSRAPSVRVIEADFDLRCTGTMGVVSLVLDWRGTRSGQVPHRSRRRLMGAMVWLVALTTTAYEIKAPTMLIGAGVDPWSARFPGVGYRCDPPSPAHLRVDHP